MGFFKSLFGGSNTPETEKEKNDKKCKKTNIFYRFFVLKVLQKK